MQLHLKLANETDKELGPFEVFLSQDDSREEKVVVINGLQTMVMRQILFSYSKRCLYRVLSKLGLLRYNHSHLVL